MKMLATKPGFTGAKALFYAMALGLGGCTALQAPPSRAVFDFGPGPTAPSASADRPAAGAVLVLERVQARAAWEGVAMQYRLAYTDAQQLRPYAQARWSMAPAELLHQRLREQLGASRTVLADGQGVAVPDGSLRLALELEEFSQVFDDAQHSVGLVRVQATLAQRHNGGERWVAQRSFSVQHPSATPDASGGAQALRSATDALAGELGAWLLAQEARAPR